MDENLSEQRLDLGVVQQDKIETSPKTTLIDHLGEQFTRWYPSHRAYLRQDPLRFKFIAVGGLAGVGKSQLIKEVWEYEDQDLVMKQAMENRGRERIRLYLNGGQMIEAAENAEILVDDQRKPLPLAECYQRLSDNAVAILTYAQSIVPANIDVDFWCEGGFVTGLRDEKGIIGGNRALSVAIYIADIGGEIIELNAPDNVSERNMEMRAEILLAEYTDIYQILKEKYGIIDKRSPWEIKAFYARTSTMAIFKSQDREQKELIHKRAGRDDLALPKIDFKYPSSLDQHPEVKFKYRTQFYDYHLRKLFLEKVGGGGVVFENDEHELAESEYFEGSDKIEKYKLTSYLDRLTSPSKKQYQRKVLHDLGVIKRPTP